MSNDFVGKTKCLVCGGIANLLINKRLRPIPEEINDKVDPRHPFCSECENTMKTGTFLISVRDGEGKTEESAKNPYRTGRICVMRAEAAERMCGKPRPPIVYIEDTRWKEMGLPEGDEDHTHPDEAKERWISATCQKCGTERGVRPDWHDKPQHSVIRTRCITCDPGQTTTTYEMFPHTLDKYKTYAPKATGAPQGATKENPDQKPDSEAGTSEVSPKAEG